MQRCVIDDAAVHILAAQIMAQAIQDWRLLTRLKRSRHTIFGKVISTDELRRFFQSEYCSNLLICTAYDNETVLKWLEQERLAGVSKHINKRKG